MKSLSFVIQISINILSLIQKTEQHKKVNDILVPRRGARMVSKQTSKWANGVISYKFDNESSFTQAEKDVITRSMNKIMEQTDNCIRFIQQTNESEYIVFNALTDRCSSFVGEVSIQPQVVSLNRASSCITQSIIIHELLHATGLLHEHDRPDRDNYIKVLFENIDSVYTAAFSIYSVDDVDTFDLPYDYFSIMHYGCYDGSKNGNLTILPLNTDFDLSKIGTTNEMTLLDVLKVKKYYGCVSNPTNTIVITLQSKLNDKFICADCSTNETLIANVMSVMDCGMFEVSFSQDSTVSLKAITNSRYVSVSASDNQSLIADKSLVDDSAKFYLIPNTNSSCFLKAKINLKYISVRNSSVPVLVANAKSSALPETFRFFIF